MSIYRKSPFNLSRVKMVVHLFYNLIAILLVITPTYSEFVDAESLDTYDIEGKVFPPIGYSMDISNWQADTKVMVKEGSYMGFLKEDGSFVVSNLPSGSYVLEVINPNFVYEPVRVEINSKGKIRARKVNYVQTSLVNQLPYPLKLKPLGQHRYFKIREQWRLTDFLFNPMVLMMVSPLLLIMILPRMLNDPETAKEMEQFNNLTNYDMPELSEAITSFLRGKTDKQKPKAIKSAKKGKPENSKQS
ncbi:unnamed protein product [Bemisia tabaci]|uniref:ER membrane protein complex subunit 7 beta-sandwich domain-containing protein n=1 Tax=Bemisia tabaci TaxID=7038 RepID=A0A9P0F1Z1_BEMTA|nr:unnamed protein product [Bemisia tabaci]